MPGSFSFTVYFILLRNETVVNAKCTIGAGKCIPLDVQIYELQVLHCGLSSHSSV